jgi:hypothetical protein
MPDRIKDYSLVFTATRWADKSEVAKLLAKFNADDEAQKAALRMPDRITDYSPGFAATHRADKPEVAELLTKFNAAVEVVQNYGTELEKVLARNTSDQLGTDAQLLVQEMRDRWRAVSSHDMHRRLSLALLHGLAERADLDTLARAQDWFSRMLSQWDAQSIPEAQQIEKSARALRVGLPTLDAERDPIAIVGVFGVIQSVDDGYADISLRIDAAATDPKIPMWEACVVPVVDLPTAYAAPGVGVVWLERTYKCDEIRLTKGRFEPASTLLKTKKARTLDVKMQLANEAT